VALTGNPAKWRHEGLSFRRALRAAEKKITMVILHKITPLKFDEAIHLTDGDQGQLVQFLGAATLRLDASRRNNLQRQISTSQCLYCGNALSREIFKYAYAIFPRYKIMHFCGDCGYWRYETNDQGRFSYDVPPLKAFCGLDVTPSIVQLSTQIKQNSELLYRMHPERFERFVGAVLSDFYKCDVRHVGGTGDDGIDLIAVIRDEPVLIQVKRRQDRHSVEGVDVVKLLFASAFAKGARAGMVVTTAKRFSRPARKWVDSPKLKDVRFSMEMKSIDNLMHMVNAVADKHSSPPWQLWLAGADPARAREILPTGVQETLNHEKANEDQQRHWKHVPGFDCDLLVDENRGSKSLIFLDHAELDSYFLLAIDSPSLIAKLSETSASEFRKVVAQQSVPHKSYLNDGRIGRRYGIPGRLMDAVWERLISVYPDRVEELMFQTGLSGSKRCSPDP
jgi:hypothetical protein